MRELTIVRKNLARRPFRSLLTIGSLAVAVAAVIALVGLSNRFEASFLELYQERGADLVVQRAGGTVQLSSGINAKIGDQIERMPHVREVIGSLMDMVSFEKTNLMAVIVNGWAPDCPVLDRVETIAGRRLIAGDRGKVMLGKVLAANLGKQVGDTIEIYSEPFEVVGIFDSFSLYESGAVFILLEELQRMMNRPHHVTGYVIQVDKSDGVNRIDEIKRQIEALDPTLAVMSTSEFVRNIAQFRVVHAMSWVTSLVALIVGVVGTSNTMVLSVLERRAEIGTLRAIGWRTHRVVRLVLSESLTMCLAGATIGSFLGSVLIKTLAWLPMTSGIVDGKLGLVAFEQGFALSLIAGLIGAAYPAYWVARLQPLTALAKH
jgi:putative ABC transport system permease protein